MSDPRYPTDAERELTRKAFFHLLDVIAYEHIEDLILVPALMMVAAHAASVSASEDEVIVGEFRKLLINARINRAGKMGNA